MEIEEFIESKECDQYVVGVIKICRRIEDKKGIVSYEAVSSERLREIVELEKNHIPKEKKNYITSEGPYIIMLFINADEEKVCELVENERKFIVDHLLSIEVTFAAIGNSVDNVRKINESSHIAKQIAELLKVDEIEDITRCYKDMGEYCLFLNIRDNSCIQAYYNKTIKPLEEYDMAHGSHLVEVLAGYLNHNGNIADVAAEQYIHRSSIVKKLETIEEILKVDLRCFEVRNRLTVGLMLSKLSKINVQDNM